MALRAANLLTTFSLKCPVSPFSISDNFGHLLISSISQISYVWNMLVAQTPFLSKRVQHD